jgi:NAD(P)-dependent dehydrogenase (short-subunit alcohol dehydrogenase family)
VTLLDIDADRLESVSKALAGLAGEARTVLADVSDDLAVKAAVTDAVDAFGGLDIVFANAGISLAAGITEFGGTLETTDLERWRRVLGVNLEGVLFTLAAAASVMKAQGAGRIVVTASTAGLRGDPLVGYAYVATKAAVINVVRQAALELAPHGINVNAIAPGPIRTNIGNAVAAEGSTLDDDIWKRTILLGRLGEPDEIKGVALLLASDAASFMTGAVIPVDGGALITYPL